MYSLTPFTNFAYIRVFLVSESKPYRVSRKIAEPRLGIEPATSVFLELILLMCYLFTPFVFAGRKGAFGGVMGCLGAFCGCNSVFGGVMGFSWGYFRV